MKEWFGGDLFFKIYPDHFIVINDNAIHFIHSAMGCKKRPGRLKAVSLLNVKNTTMFPKNRQIRPTMPEKRQLI